ncbi:MAG: DUF4124 domain-containing protein [Arenicellales bacterium]
MAQRLSMRILLGCFLASVILTSVHGQEIYKTVDESGNVSYSTNPPKAAEESDVIDLLPEPSEAEVSKAQRRQIKIQEKLEKAKQAREEKSTRLAKAGASTGPGTVIIMQPSPAVLLNPYSHYGGYRWYYSARPGYRNGPHSYRHSQQGHRRGRMGHKPRGSVRPVPYN